MRRQTLETDAAIVADFIKTAIARVEMNPALASLVREYFEDEHFGEDEPETKAFYAAILTWLAEAGRRA